MRNKKVFKLVFAAIMMSAAVVLDVVFKAIPFLDFPNGGSFNLAMFPVVVAAIVCGPLYGVACGVGFGFLNFLVDGGGTLIWSLILDYIVGFGVLGVAGLFRKQIYQNKKMYFVLAFVLAVMLRWIASSFSGVINAAAYGINEEFLAEIFGPNKTGVGYIYIYTFILYNLPYLSASAVGCIAVGLIGYNRIFSIDIDKIAKEKLVSEEEQKSENVA